MHDLFGTALLTVASLLKLYLKDFGHVFQNNE